MTDGTGAYEVLRTMLYYYCSERYDISLNCEGIRLVGDEISEEEWIDPVANRTSLPIPPRNEMPDALNLIASACLENDRRHNEIVYDLQDGNELELPNINLPWTEIHFLCCYDSGVIYES